MVANLFEAPRLQADQAAGDLHYVLRDPQAGEVLATAMPVAVGEVRQPAGMKRFFRSTPGHMPGETQAVPRVTLRVVDGHGATLFYVDRAERVVGHGGVPECAVVDPAGGVVGYFTNDHYKFFDRSFEGPVDGNGMTHISGREHLRDRDHEVLCDVVGLLDKAAASRGAVGDGGVLVVGRDQSIWARLDRQGIGPVMEVNPQVPRHHRMLLAAILLAGRLGERLLLPLIQGSFDPPEPLAGEPYPGYGDVHSFYMRYQEEFIAWYKKEMRGVHRLGSA
ncbi:hypothetical protein ACGFNU_25320 [Spirillospora sp. NPDC048911]|uniref:hypothetical protein n=1 Tax=Spirillospora sp. NPDC048911 TaxID=3364527 RepID=UPI0037178575